MPTSIPRIIFGLAITLFIPGFAITLVVFPGIGVIERVALSSVLSIVTVLLTALFLDMVLGIDWTAGNITLALLSITSFFLIIWALQNRKSIGKMIKNKWPVSKQEVI